MRPRLRRAALLLLAVATTAMADAGLDDGDQVRDVPVSGVYGDYLAGRSALAAGQAEEASRLFDAAQPLDPNSTELTSQALLASVLAGHPDPALAEKLPNVLIARLVLINRDVLAGNWVSAQARAGALGEDGISQVLRPLLVAWSQAGAGQTDAALATLEPYVAGNRFRGVYAMHAGLIADGASRPGDAARFYRITQSEFGQLNLRLGTVLASWQARLGHEEEAATIVRSTVTAAPDVAIAQEKLLQAASQPAVSGPAQGMAEAYLALAASLGGQDGINAGPALLRLALQLRPDFTPARIVVGDLLGLAHHPDAALAVLADVTADDPLADVVTLRRGALLDDAGRKDEAVSTLQALAAARPERAEPFAALGDVQRRAGQFAEAVASYSKAVAAGGTREAQSWSLFYERGVALDRAGDWDRAQGDFLHALELSPDQPLVLNYLGYGWTERGQQLPRARDMLERAVMLRPEDAAIIDSLGWVLLHLGDTDGATARLQRAAELDPEDPSINGHLGDAYQAAGRLREAEWQWRRALNFHPDGDELARIEGKLRELPAN